MVKWTSEAEKDLKEIALHIAHNYSREFAESIIYESIEFLEDVLEENPLIGKLVEDNLLFSKFIYKGNAVYYCENPKDGNLYIVHVHPRHTALDSKRLKLETHSG